ncbi:hypothetical protein PTKIN_Ptkin02bG0048900 [Pterospermum kingtungense]
METEEFGHEHPLVELFNEEQTNQDEASPTHECSRCGEVILSGPSFKCAEEVCGFYLHKECAEAPSQLNHPFHRNHPLCLLPNPPAKYSSGTFGCNFCGETGQLFDYHCSDCDTDLHIRCALFTHKLADKKLGELKLITASKDPPIISSENGSEEVESAKCFGCLEPLADSVYYSLEYCGINLHKKCVELPLEINYPGHHKHPLILQFKDGTFPCVICQETDLCGFFYCCSLCKFGIHISCLSSPSIIEDKGHPHPFTLFMRQVSFNCDVCGIEGNCVPYMCSSCNLLVHKKCISVPRIIKFMWHEHPIFHTYFIQKHGSETWDCVLCLTEVNTEHGSYYSSDCHFVVHVNCVLRSKQWYYVIEQIEKLGDNDDIPMDSFTVIQRNEDGEAIEIKHCFHAHNIMLEDEVMDDDVFCHGCTLPISDGSFYECPQCDYFLHKTCAELPQKKHIWYHVCQIPLFLVSDYMFECCTCRYVSNGFVYRCEECGRFVCLRCAVPSTLTCQGHEHPLSYYTRFEGQCNACGNNRRGAYKCKECDFALDFSCITLPNKVPHKCDAHLLTLTYGEKDTYSARHFCDICEEGRDPNLWFYYCSICDNSAHPKCVLGRYPFMKLGDMRKREEHPHLITFVKKMYDYPKCFKCDLPCQDLALECIEPGCEYIIHWDCIEPGVCEDSVENESLKQTMFV